MTMACYLPKRANKDRPTGKILGAFYREAQSFRRLGLYRHDRCLLLIHFFSSAYYEVGLRNLGLLIVVVFFTLTDRASTIPSTIRGCQSGTWSAGQKEIRGTSTKLQ